MTEMPPEDQRVESANVHVVAVDAGRQPRYLARAAELQEALLRVAAEAGLTADDMPGLHGLCMEAIRRAERHHRKSEGLGVGGEARLLRLGCPAPAEQQLVTKQECVLGPRVS